MLINIDGYTIETKEIISVSKIIETFNPSSNSVGFFIMFSGKQPINFVKKY